MIAPVREPLFELGVVVVTPAALKVIKESGDELDDYLGRHVRGDWGSVFAQEQRRNDEAIDSGERISSEFRAGNGIKIWVVTDAADSSGRRSRTTILLPSEAC